MATGLREQVRQFELARVDESVWKEREDELRRATEMAATQKQQVEQAADNMRQQLHEALVLWIRYILLELDSAVGHQEELQRRQTLGAPWSLGALDGGVPWSL